MDYTELRRFEKELREWYAEAEKQKNEFCITESDPHADERSGLVPETAIAILKPPEQGALTRFKVWTEVTYLKTVVHYLKTLPPLRYLTADEEVTNAKVRRHLDELYWFKPTRPPSSFLHLKCVLRTHALSEFETAFPRQLFARHHLQRALRARVTPFGELLASRRAVDAVAGTSAEIYV